ncbi:MAG: C10 family peptidase [Bacteroidales bacterium]|nr:C10 family peptidase [Bacteroidales bacterium]
MVILIPSRFAQGQMVNIEEAARLAENWINVIMDEQGSWGAHHAAKIFPPEEIRSDSRLIGYLCNVKPEGYIILSLRRELAPVKAYSPRGYFDPESEDIGTDIIKSSMAYLIDTIQSRLGPIEDVTVTALKPLLEIDYTGTWDAIYNYVPGTWKKKPEGDNGETNYQEGDIMLEGNNWHQYPPYNEFCPYMACTTTSNGRAFVGCVATAGSQIMYHWSWPPYGVSPYNDSYDWPNMKDVVTTSSPQVEINAVAELGYEVALAVNMGFGCEGSGAIMYEMEGVFENYFRYSTACNTVWRQNYTSSAWFELIKDQCNLNRPMEYGITGHAILCDGWQEIGSPAVKQYHMNWGWTATGNDTWYTLDALPGGGFYIEHFVGNVVPSTALGSWINGTYGSSSFPYRYFDRDAIGYGAEFTYGQFLQFLPGVQVCGMSSTSPIRFSGTDFLNLRLFSHGDLSHGIRIGDGAIRLTNYGSIKFY